MEEVEPEHSMIWKNRELLLKIRVLQTQLTTELARFKASKQIKESTLESLNSTKEIIKSSLDNQSPLRTRRGELQNHLDHLNKKLSLTKGHINRRSKRMIYELWDIYPIVEFPDRKGYSICNIHLPSSEHYEGHDETMVSVAIGYVSHLLLLISDILDVTLRFPIKYYGSRSVIYCTRRNQLFPLYLDSFKSRDWANFSYGVNLLNLDIVQLRTLYGLSTKDPDETLSNLHGLKIKLDNED